MINISNRCNEFFPYVLYTLRCIINLIEIVLAAKRGIWWTGKNGNENLVDCFVFVTLFNNYKPSYKRRRQVNKIVIKIVSTYVIEFKFNIRVEIYFFIVFSQFKG